jgi:eukaryotic-like serine/threonine-protein kinase
MSDVSPAESPRSPSTPSGGTRVLPLAATPAPSDQATGPYDDDAASSSVIRRAAEQDSILSDFEFVKEVGRGGMGIVYKARQKSLTRNVAIKMLLGDPARNPTVLARFQSEARSAAALRHPNIVAVYQIGECAGGHFFVMEYVKGPSLEAVLERQKPDQLPPVMWTVNLMLPIVEAVHYAHTQGIIHRDLKPANIMIDRASNRPVVLDFGIARRLDEPAGLTRAGVVVGTPSYMPPEQAGEAGGAVGPASDVYALGAILYRILTGRLAYQAETALATLLLVAGPDMPPPVRKLRPEVPQTLSLICMKCLNKRPGDRYASADALARDLRSFLAGVAAANTPASEPPLPAVVAGPYILLVSEQTSEEIQLTRAANLIGRSSDCDVMIKKPDVSKRHCRILLSADGAEIEDLNSVNGTSLNGQPVTRQDLKDGDRLEIAEYAFRVNLHLPPKKSSDG